VIYLILPKAKEKDMPSKISSIHMQRQ